MFPWLLLLPPRGTCSAKAAGKTAASGWEVTCHGEEELCAFIEKALEKTASGAWGNLLRARVKVPCEGKCGSALEGL